MKRSNLAVAVACTLASITAVTAQTSQDGAQRQTMLKRAGSRVARNLGTATNRFTQSLRRCLRAAHVFGGVHRWHGLSAGPRHTGRQ